MQKNCYLLNLLVLLFGLTFSNLAVSPAIAAVTADVYTPVVDESEISVFLETSCSNAKVWAWNGKTKCNSNGDWPGDAMTLMGTTSDGKNIFKWTCAKSTAPANVIFTHDGGTKWLDEDMEYVNHGYYVDGVYSKTITNHGHIDGGNVWVYFDNTTANLANVYCYIYSESQAAVEWPGYKMTFDESATYNGTTGWYTAKVPEPFEIGYFVINDGTAGKTLAGETVYVKENVATGVEATTITEVKQTTDDGWYTLTGIRVSKPTQTGIYIHNGKKVIIRK